MSYGQGPVHQCGKDLTQKSGEPERDDKLTRVEEIPQFPGQHETYYLESRRERPRYTHDLFPFGAKFHPPVVSWALDTFGKDGVPVLDPFTGSGTVQVEALVRGMRSVGIDVDPLACFVTRAKTTPLPATELESTLRRIDAILGAFARSSAEFEKLSGADISPHEFERQSQGLSWPEIPNLFHWFRRHVVVDLARLFWAIEEATSDGQQADFFRACAAAIIRRVSNADPAPLSGLEVTRIQAERNATRVIRVFDQFLSRAQKAIHGMHELSSACGEHRCSVTTAVLQGDSLKARDLLADARVEWQFPLVVTSPPYCTAVEYSRRHKLEMYWLGLVESRDQHLELSRSYIGRRGVRLCDWDDAGRFDIKDLDRTLAKISRRNRVKARALSHYFWSMCELIREISAVMPKSGTLVCAVGDSVCYGVPVRTTRFLTELAAQSFTLENNFSYALRNRRMQYPLRNGVGIGREHILVLRRR